MGGVALDVLWEGYVCNNTNITLSNDITNYDAILVIPAIYRSDSSGGIWYENCRAEIWLPNKDGEYDTFYFSGIASIANNETTKITYSSRILIQTDSVLMLNRYTGFANSLTNNSVVLHQICGVKFGSSSYTVYSHTQQRIGTWTNGKPLYQIIYDDYIIPSGISNVNTQIYDLSSLNISKICDLQVTICSITDTESYSNNYIDNAGAYAVVRFNASSNLVLKHNGFEGFNVVATVKYTKTTD